MWGSLILRVLEMDNGIFAINYSLLFVYYGFSLLSLRPIATWINNSGVP